MTSFTEAIMLVPWIKVAAVEIEQRGQIGSEFILLKQMTRFANGLDVG